MTIARKTISIFIIAIGTLIVLFGALMLFDAGKQVRHTIDNNNEIKELFLRSSAFIESFQGEHARIPSLPEFDAWAESQADSSGRLKTISFLTDSFPEEALELFGDPPAGAYLLEIWRGEWSEYYASWVDRDSLPADESKYYITRLYWWTDVLLLLSVGALAVYIGRNAWPRRSDQALPRP